MSMHVMIQSGVTSCDRDANRGGLLSLPFCSLQGIQTQTLDISTTHTGLLNLYWLWRTTGILYYPLVVDDILFSTHSIIHLTDRVD
jgi:hypothetical protein